MENLQVSENLREKATELFKNTAEEIASCDMIAEFSVKDNNTGRCATPPPPLIIEMVRYQRFLEKKR